MNENKEKHKLENDVVESMKTISELAKELNISPQAIYKKINNQLSTELSTHVHKGLNNKTLIDSIGQTIIRDSLNHSCESSCKPVDNGLQLVELLKKQLEVKDRQIGELSNQNESLIQKLENMQILLKNEQEKNTLMLIENKNKKPSFFQRLFKKEI